MVMPYHLHMPSYFLETFTEYPYENTDYADCIFTRIISVICIYSLAILSSPSSKLFFSIFTFRV